MIKKCPYCKSIWVCWNWLHFDQWGHECWTCENALMTKDKVKNGIPYWILRTYGFIKYRIFKSE